MITPLPKEVVWKDAFGIRNGDDRVFHFGDGFLNQSLEIFHGNRPDIDFW